MAGSRQIYLVVWFGGVDLSGFPFTLYKNQTLLTKPIRLNPGYLLDPTNQTFD